MAGLATKETNKNVLEYIETIEPENKKKDAKTLLSIMQEITGCEPKIWGDYFIIGFRKYTYKRKSGKEEYEWFKVGFAIRKNKITLYLTCDIAKEQEILSKLGKCKWGKGCLYINKLADIKIEFLIELIVKHNTSDWE